MTEEQQKVKDFHKKFGIVINEKPTLANPDTRALRIRLIKEELEELIVAIKADKLDQVADALGDLLYVVYGAGVSFGIDLEPVFNEIHRTNMMKEGGRRRKDGKHLKPVNWQPPDIKSILQKQEE